MKRKLYFVIVGLLVLMSCNDVEMVEGQLSKSKVKAILEQSSSSSRLLVDGTKLSWADDDQLVRFYSDGTEQWKLVDGAGTGTANFELIGEAMKGDKMGAAYPSSYDPKLNDSELTMTLPSNKVVTDACDLPMWASPNNESLEFIHLSAVLKMLIKNIPEGNNTLIVEADKPIAGTFSANINVSGGKQGLKYVENGSNKVVITLKEGQTEQELYLPLPMGEYQYIKFSLSNDEGLVQLGKREGRAIERLKLYTIDLTYNSSKGTTAQLSEDLKNVFNEEVESIKTITIEEIDEAIHIPSAEGKDGILTLISSNAPVTDETNPLKFTGESTTSDAIPDKVVLEFPNDESNPLYLEIENPSNTFVLSKGYYEMVTAATASQTLIIEKGVVVKRVIIKKGNVILRGKIEESIEKHTENEEETKIIVDGGTEPVEYVGDFIIDRTSSAENSNVTNGTWDE